MRYMSMREDIINLTKKAERPDIFNLELAGISYCDGSYKISRKNSRIYVFEYIIKGQGFLNINSREFEPKGGDVYIAHSGTDHSYWSSSQNPWTKIWFNVSGLLVENLMETYGLSNVFHISNCYLEKLFKEGLVKIRQDIFSAHYLASLIIHEIIMKISSYVASQKEKVISPEAIKLKNYLDANIMKKMTLNTMGRLVSKSPSQTIRIFKKEYGTTPYNYLLEQRIRVAKLLLENTMKTIKEIAYELGFKDEYYFSNIFKKKTETSPLFYRKKHLEQ